MADVAIPICRFALIPDASSERNRLMSSDDAGTLQLLKACETSVIEPTVAQHKGRIVKRMGDG